MRHYSEIIKKLNLTPLPEEGGFYRETYRSKRMVTSEALGEKSECTVIYYLITEESFSALHLVDMDEVFHFYAGSPVEMFQINQNGEGSKITIGNDIFNDEIPQVFVPHGIWQGTKLKDPKEGDWALLGCTVAPGFDIENFHIKGRKELCAEFPHLSAEIERYTN